MRTIAAIRPAAVLSAEQRAAVRDAVRALTPMSEEQIKAVCAMLNAAYTRSEHRAARTTQEKPPAP